MNFGLKSTLIESILPEVFAFLTTDENNFEFRQGAGIKRVFLRDMILSYECPSLNWKAFIGIGIFLKKQAVDSQSGDNQQLLPSKTCTKKSTRVKLAKVRRHTSISVIRTPHNSDKHI